MFDRSENSDKKICVLIALDFVSQLRSCFFSLSSLVLIFLFQDVCVFPSKCVINIEHFDSEMQKMHPGVSGAGLRWRNDNGKIRERNTHDVYVFVSLKCIQKTKERTGYRLLATELVSTTYEAKSNSKTINTDINCAVSYRIFYYYWQIYKKKHAAFSGAIVFA